MTPLTRCNRYFSIILIGLVAVTNQLMAGNTAYKDWDLDFPYDETIGETHGDIELSADATLYVSVRAGPRPGIQKYNNEGHYLGNIPNVSSGFHDFLLIEPVAAPAYIIGVLPTQVVFVDLHGNRLKTLDVAEIVERSAVATRQPRNKPLRLSGLALASDGSLFVIDGYGDDDIYRFSAEGELIAILAGKIAPLNLQNAHKIMIDQRALPERLLITDREHFRILSVSLDGSEVEEVAAELGLPSAMAQCGEAFIVAELEGRVVVLDDKGGVAKVLSESSDYGSLPRGQRPSKMTHPSDWVAGLANRPHGLACGEDDSIYVSDWSSSGRVLKLALH